MNTINTIAIVIATHVPGTSFMTTVYGGILTMVVAAIAVAVAQIIMFRRGY